MEKVRVRALFGNGGNPFRSLPHVAHQLSFTHYTAVDIGQDGLARYQELPTGQFEKRDGGAVMAEV